MSKSKVQFDYDELQKLKEQIEKLGDPSQMDQFFESCAKELAARLLAKVIKRTPVGQYPVETGKKGGTLRRGWTTGNSDMKVTKVGTDYVIEIINPVEYASYVEFGHRTRNHKGWVEGKFMLTISEEEIRKSAPRILEKKLEKYLKECFQ